MPNKTTIKFMKHYVTDGTLKARVHYSHYKRTTDGRLCVVIYAKDYERNLGKIIPDAYKNDTDTMTDYFDKGSVTLLDDHPLYPAALLRAKATGGQS